MIRSVGKLGPVKVAGVVAWRLRWDLVAIVVVAGALLPVPDPTQIDYAAAVLSVLGIGASVFIGFRNTIAYNRWWEARTLWGSIIINSRATHNGLCSVDTGSPQIGAVLTGCVADKPATAGSWPPNCGVWRRSRGSPT